jgi:hypothetical protein
MSFEFMGHHFDTREQLARVFPAFAGDDAIRAMRAGATTPLEVEQFCWRHRNQAYIKARAAAQRSAFQKRALKGIAKSNATPKSKGRRRKAA